ncbi:MAG: hypothetical protein H0X37_15770 [Herpetosiphonaceae bacterium]|nr:hypothetical protein [Herpetosiphonaceae bacterium]
MENSWGAIWYKWAPALLTAPFMLVAYLAAALLVPHWLASHLGFWLVLVITTAVAGLVLATISRRLNLFIRDAKGTFLRDPELQGNTSSQLAVLACWFILPRLGIQQPFWSYVIASLAVGAVSMAIFPLVASWTTKAQTASAGRRPLAASISGSRPSTKIAPPWAQRVAKICLALGALSLFRLIIDHTPHFLWGGLILLAVGSLLPSLVVILGGGREPQA